MDNLATLDLVDNSAAEYFAHFASFNIYFCNILLTIFKELQERVYIYSLHV
jgi:hypothetical protein